MVTKTEQKKIRWTPETPVTMELLDEYVSHFHVYEEQEEFITAARAATAEMLKRKLRVCLSWGRETKTPITSTKDYTMKDLMTEAIYFYDGFKAGGCFIFEEVKKRTTPSPTAGPK